jgi:hypothetical protein
MEHCLEHRVMNNLHDFMCLFKKLIYGRWLFRTLLIRYSFILHNRSETISRARKLANGFSKTLNQVKLFGFELLPQNKRKGSCTLYKGKSLLNFQIRTTNVKFFRSLILLYNTTHNWYTRSNKLNVIFFY